MIFYTAAYWHLIRREAVFSFFKKKSPPPMSIEPTVSDLYGDMPQDSFFEKVACSVQQRMTLSESSYKVDWSKVPVVKPDEPNYAGLIAMYAYQLALDLETDTMSLMFESTYTFKYKDGRRLDRFAANYVFYLFGGLHVAQALDASQLERFIKEYKLNLIQQFIFDKSELATFGASAAMRGEVYFKALCDDQKDSTKKFLEDIGKFFVASVALRTEVDSHKFDQIKDYGKKMFCEFERSLLSLKI
jgi:hypothetical protein